MAGCRLYKRATAGSETLGPLWLVDEDRTFFVGPLDYNGPHQHGAPVYLAGIYGAFRLRIPSGRWLSCRAAVIPAGVLHELNLGGNPLAVLYIEPSVDGVEALIPLINDAYEVNGTVIGRTGEFSILRDLWEDKNSVTWTGQTLDDLLAFSKRRAARRMDPRISAALGGIQTCIDECAPVAQLARSVGISSSRFQHLFTQEVGVPFRRYRAWSRMRIAIQAITQGSNFTTAAYTAGFADQAHFTNDFRRTFGAPPSGSLLGIRI